MLKRKNRKGFTLAELLIVVAIIAVLVAIAVPLFVGALGRAEEATKNANIRNTRSTAVVYLLENNGKTDVWGAAASSGKVRAWSVSAKISANGDFTELKVDPVSGGIDKGATSADVGQDTEKTTYTTTGEATKGSDGSYTVRLLLTETIVTDLES